MKWEGSVVLVTGASRGIGAAVARAAAAKGAKVGLMARPSDDLNALAQELGDKCFVATADVSDASAVERAVAAVTKALGPIDILINNAGIGLYGAFLDVDPKDVERLVQTNITGVFNVAHAVIPGMVERKRGHVVTIGSIAGRIGSPFEAIYSATKFAAVGMAEAMAIELLPFNVGSTIVNPGPVVTSFGEARGHPYDRKSPKAIPATQVSTAVIKAVERNTFEIYLPKSLGPAVKIRHLLPSIFRFGTSKAFTKELAEEKRIR